MIKASEIVQVSPKYLGTPYNTLDCQAFVEKCLRDCGNSTNLAGSNAWYRKVMQEGWVGSPEECKKQFGMIPVGAFLFILSDNGKEPEKYKKDGIGNASHIGIYTSLTGKQMVQMAKDDGNAIAGAFNYGNGAIHSSSTYGAVCTSNFAGKAINGGWNRIGLWNKIDYGIGLWNQPEEEAGGKTMAGYQAKVVGGRLNLREQPSSGASKVCQIPDGEVVNVTDETGNWAKTSYSGNTGWVIKDYLEPVTADGDTIAVNRKRLEALYDELGDMLGLRG